MAWCSTRQRIKCSPVELIQLYLADISNYNLLTPEREKSLFKQLADTSSQAVFRAIWLANLGLVIFTVTEQYTKTVFSRNLYMELIQAGNIGLHKAISKFDYTTGNKFSTCAILWIKREITRELEISRLVKLPDHIIRSVNRFHKAQRIIGGQGGYLTAENLSAVSGLSVKTCQALLIWHDDVGHLNGCQAPESETPEQCLERAELHRMVQSLTAQERVVIIGRYGLDGNGKRRLVDLAKVVGCSTENVRLVEKRALGKLRQAWGG